MNSHTQIQALTFDFYQTLVYHREGRGRGAVLMDYLLQAGFEPVAWEHAVLYDVFGPHADEYSPAAPAGVRAGYYNVLAGRVFKRLGIRLADGDAARHAGPLWEILGPSSLAVFPDVAPVLEELRGRRLPLAVISNWQRGLRHFIAELGLARFFDHVIGSADLGAAKPEPRIFEETCRLLGVPPSRTLHVGDTFVDDYQGARSAGLECALIDRKGESPAPVERVIRGLEELPGLLERIPGDQALR